MRPSPNKFDPLDTFRAEIESRTALGQTCEQIAEALRARGAAITNKTISRRRLEWGLRKRAVNKTSGRKYPNAPRRKPPSETGKGVKLARKAEIHERSRNGESAAQIALALRAEGADLKKGESTILRLQTRWGLIPRDPDRSKGRKRKAAAQTQKLPFPGQGRIDLASSRAQQTQADGSGAHLLPDDGGFVGGELQAAAALDNGDSAATGREEGSESALPSVSVATDIMSAEFLVDLANSTLTAATGLRSMLLAYHAQTPLENSDTPPSLEDLSTARRKVREAAAVMHDLAIEPVGDELPS